MASPPQNHFTFENYNSSCLHCTDWNNVLVSDRKIQASARQTNDSNDIKETEDLLSNELSKLSMNERSQAYDDLHCVGDELQETPEMVEKSLFEFDQAISKHRNSAYDIAWKQNKAYVEDPSFRLKFLRAQMHNVSKAVHQMMNFLRYKGEFFGEDKIARDITLADLSEEDKELMMSGILHIQAERDRMGRVVLYTLTKDCGRFKPESTYRVCYYMLYNILVSLPEVQMKGLVEIFLDTPRPQEEKLIPISDPSFRKSLDASFSIPFRTSAYHFFQQATNSSQMIENSILAVAISCHSLYTRVRTRIHRGTVMELQYKLQSHGIPSDTFPVDMNGQMRKDSLNAWFYEHLAKEGMMKTLPLGPLVEKEEDRFPEYSSSGATLAEGPYQAPYSNVGLVTSPSGNDILSGRGPFFQKLPANVRFRKFLEDRIDEYNKLGRHERMVYTIKLTHLLHANNVRFLKQTTNGDWVTLDASEVRTKVSQQFRTIRKKK